MNSDNSYSSNLLTNRKVDDYNNDIIKAMQIKNSFIREFAFIMETIKTNQGGAKLLLDGYSYNRKKTGDKQIYWRCSNEKKFNCKGSVKTSFDVSYIIIFL